MAESEGVEHVGAGALGGGALVVGSGTWGCRRRRRLRRGRVRSDRGRGVGDPSRGGVRGVGVEFLDEGADGLGLGAVGVDVDPPELPCDEEQQQEADGDKEFACNLDDPVQHGAGRRSAVGAVPWLMRSPLSFGLCMFLGAGGVPYLQRTEKVKSSRKSAKIGVNIYF